MELIVASLAMLTIFLLTLGLHNLFFGSKYELRKRMQLHVGSYGLYSKNMAANSKDDSSLKEKIRQPLQYGKFFTSKSLGSSLELQLQKANILLRGYEFVMLSIGTAAITFLIGIFTKRPLFVSVILGFLGLFLPWTYMKVRQISRMKAFNGQVCDALMLMSNSLKAGHGIMQALEMVTREMPPPMSEEFARMMKEINLGVNTEEALQNMSNRMGNDDWDMTITAILIQRQTGGSLSEILDNISETVRERIRIKGEINSLTAQGRLSGIVIAVLPLLIGLVLLVLNPPYLMTLFDNEIGRIMIYGAVFSEMIGFFLIQKIVNIKV